MKRLTSGISQEQLAKANGLSFQQIQKYEKGVDRISASRLFEIATFLNVPISYFFQEMGGDQVPVESLRDNSLISLRHRETLELIRAYFQIKSRKSRQAILGLIRSLADELSG